MRGSLLFFWRRKMSGCFSTGIQSLAHTWAHFLFPVLLFCGCESLPFNRDPLSGPLPYVFEESQSIPYNGLLMDLDRDGREELIGIHAEKDVETAPHIKIYNSDFEFLEQVNFNGRLQRPFALDWDSDGGNEIAVPYTYRDTLRLRILSNRGAILKDAPLYSGQARVDSSGVFSWLGNVDHLSYPDLEGDGSQEIVVFANETLAGAPRGIFVFEPPSLTLKWKYEIGPRLAPHPAIVDFNGDGFYEFVLPTSAPSNGNEANCTDDEHSYLFVLDHRGDLLWRRMFGGPYSAALAQVTDVDGDGDVEIVAYYHEWKLPQHNPRIEIVDPQNGRVLRTRTFPLDEYICLVAQIDTDLAKELLVASESGEIVLYNHRFEVIKSRKYNCRIGGLCTSEDLDGDGFKELFMSTNKGTFWLSRDLSVQAKTSMEFANTYAQFQLYHQSRGRPLLAMFRDDEGALVALQRDSDYLISYYGPPLGFLLGCAAVLGIIAYAVYSHAQRQKLQKLLEKSVTLHDEPLFLMDDKMRILFVNAAARALLGQPTNLPMPFETLEQKNPNLAKQVAFLRECDAKRQERRFTLPENDPSLHLIAEPLLESYGGRPHWWVLVQKDLVGDELRKSRMWAAMAQRIAHEIKNPLTTILLTLQRLQLEYRDRESPHASVYDHYTERMIERIESVRRMSRGFMKFLNLEKVNPQPTDINQFVEKLFSHSSIELPDDIQLQMKMASDLPPAHVDQEQMQTLLENLIANAINAMPEGGSLTLSTGLAPDLQLKGTDAPPRDYIFIEVIDTGTGIPSDIKDQLFQPFSSQTRAGTGLGLTIVKKIVDDHHGHIEVSSEPGVGTSFTVYLPVS